MTVTTIIDGPIVVTEPGLPGPQGPPGPPGGAYRHIQASAAAVWTITHNLGFYPNVSVVDSAGSVVIGNARHLDGATVQITFSAGFAGEAYLT